ncbi:MAG: SIMPL domain-containing protein [Patescibacteria group bacterium]|nr:SIMPL domain-containing protein [Patescibacteria group bacterium]MDD4304833.1 SIMPL domain-containing protein [Patescibacteria group bacterium]MDD4695805.1 SIMPL domain-containing protein [Patescibacteria group bacterium]
MEEETKKCYFIDYPKHIIAIILILGMIALGILSILRDRIVNVERNQLTVSAEGKIFAKPDIAQIGFGVKTDTKKEVAQVVEDGTVKMNAVIEKMKALGIEEKDIKTTQYNLSPIYSYPQNTGARVLSGYELYQEVTVKIRNLDTIGNVIKESANLGANQIGNVNFTIDDTDALKAEARKQAIEKAKAKAKELSKQTGIKLGKIINVYEDNYYEPMYRNDFAYSSKEALGMGGDAMMTPAIPDIQSGNMEVRLNVTLMYKVK